MWATEDALVPQRPGHRRQHRWNRVLYIPAVAALVAFGGWLVFWSVESIHQTEPRSTAAGTVTPRRSGTPTAAPSDPAAVQAIAVNELLSSSKQAHDRLTGTLDTCDDVSAAAPMFEQLVRDRQQELSQAQSVAVDQLQDGLDLHQALIDTYRYSLTADQGYLAWARDTRDRGCGAQSPSYNTQDYRDALAGNVRAKRAKQRLVVLWDPIARSHRLPTYTWQEF